MDVLWAKITAMILLGGVSLLVGLAPLCFKRFVMRNQGKGSKTSLFISALSCLGGGVILATCLTHMLPEINMLLNQNIEIGQFPNTGLAMGEILVLCGFFMIYIVEEVTHLVIDRYMPDKKGHGHAHEEIPADLIDQDASFEATLRGFLVILALSLHAVFEGIAMGLTNEESSVWFLFFAVASHKYVISFCVGMQFVASGIKNWVTVLYVATFALISPLGAGIGIALSETSTSDAELQNGTVVVLQGLACGTLLYVVFFEVIEKERVKGTNGILQVVFLILGATIMVCMELLEIKITGGADPHMAGMKAISAAKLCELRNFDVAWQLPMNFTCQAGVLRAVF